MLRLVELCATDGVGFGLQMEFCPRTLKKILVAGPIEECDAWQVMTPVSDTVLLIQSHSLEESGLASCSASAHAHCSGKC